MPDKTECKMDVLVSATWIDCLHVPHIGLLHTAYKNYYFSVEKLNEFDEKYLKYMNHLKYMNYINYIKHDGPDKNPDNKLTRKDLLKKRQALLDTVEKYRKQYLALGGNLDG